MTKSPDHSQLQESKSTKLDCELPIMIGKSALKEHSVTERKAPLLIIIIGKCGKKRHVIQVHMQERYKHKWKLESAAEQISRFIC